MKVQYTIEQRTLAEEDGLQLDPDAELAWLRAPSEAARRALIESLVRQHAAAADDWVYDIQVSFTVQPDD